MADLIDYRLTANALEIDGQNIEWPISAEGPRVEPLDGPAHILWVPFLAKGSLLVGAPGNTEPAPVEEEPDHD